MERREEGNNAKKECRETKARSNGKEQMQYQSNGKEQMQYSSNGNNVKERRHDQMEREDGRCQYLSFLENININSVTSQKCTNRRVVP
jgi:hypothetical protein